MGTFASKTFNPEQDLPDLTGKVVLVTGGNAGIGYGTIKHLARKGAKVYMAARNKAKAEAAITQLNAEGFGPGNGEVVWIELDLSDPRNAKKTAQAFKTKEDRLDVLSVPSSRLDILAAKADHSLCSPQCCCVREMLEQTLPTHGLLRMFEPYEIFPDGVQKIMVVNLISPFVLTRELLPVLKKTASQSNSDVRVVMVSSEGHRVLSDLPRFRTIEDLNDECKHSWVPTFIRYCLSKLAIILYASELQRRLSSDPSTSNIIATSVHPGWVNTWTDRPLIVRLHLSTIITVLGHAISVVPDVGAYTSVFAAAAPVVKKEREKYAGAYLVPVGRAVKPSVGMWKRVIEGQREVTVREVDEEWAESGEELWEVIERFLEERGI
ncbi:hypothetical protein V8B97DRAFT_2002394 [Scleroderma yunnanense]